MYSGDENITLGMFADCLHFEAQQNYSWSKTKALSHAKALLLQVSCTANAHHQFNVVQRAGRNCLYRMPSCNRGSIKLICALLDGFKAASETDCQLW
jgi:hypothetical protein